MNNEKGVTLIELLISVVIAGMVIVPLLLIMTGSLTRTVKQGEDTQLTYYGQQIMEKIRDNGYEDGTKYYCYKDQGCISSNVGSYEAEVSVTAKRYPSTIELYEIEVLVTSESSSHKLVTVVKK